ncbi:MAG: hypothetical protein QM756_29575 [Polyangiaceae bacterium]
MATLRFAGAGRGTAEPKPGFEGCAAGAAATARPPIAAAGCTALFTATPAAAPLNATAGAAWAATAAVTADGTLAVAGIDDGTADALSA